MLIIIVFCLFGLGLIRNNLTGQNLLAASRNLHNKALRNLVRLPVKYFDQHSTGFVMSRLSSDIAKLDE